MSTNLGDPAIAQDGNTMRSTSVMVADEIVSQYRLVIEKLEP
jgi:hypothetical protein